MTLRSLRVSLTRLTRDDDPRGRPAGRPPAAAAARRPPARVTGGRSALFAIHLATWAGASLPVVGSRLVGWAIAESAE